MKHKKGVFFSIDALIALVIVMVIILVAFPLITGPEYKSNIHYDILTVLSTIKTGEISGLPSNLKPNPDKLAIDQIGEFYSKGNLSLAEQLASQILDEIKTKENIGIWFGETLIWSKNNTPYDPAQNERIDTARQIVSGIQNGSSVQGFSARAFLQQSNPVKYFYFGGYVGEGNLTLQINYTGEIDSAELELAIPKDFELSINNNPSGDYLASLNEFTPSTYIINETYLQHFNSGSNTLEFKGDYLYIAGGFLKITYASNTTQEQQTRYNFPGIEGIINLYDGLYIPGQLTSMNIFLHLNNTILPTFLNIGNTTVYNNLTNDEETVTLDNTFLDSLLDYGAISEKTIPIRLGMENISYFQNGTQKQADIVSVTDLSGSMQNICSGGNFLCCLFSGDFCGSEPTCQSCGGTFQTPLDDAKAANELLIDLILNSSGNRIGLVGYSNDALPSDYHTLSNDSISLKTEVNEWQAAGATCICCGILDATTEIVDNAYNDITSIVIMSDGEANIDCNMDPVPDHDLDGDTTDDPQDHAIEAACIAFDDENITTHAVGFGAGIDEQTLQRIAVCGNGTYYFADVGNLSETYENIAQDLIEAFYVEQTVEFTEEIYTRLYPDSYIEFSYSTNGSDPFGLIITNEEKFINDTTGNFTVPQNSTIVEARVTSYSGPRWTNNIKINNNTFYNLSNYNNQYVTLGDPYSINIPNQLISIGGSNTVVLTTASSTPSNSSGGSEYNKVIYTFAREVASYSDIYGLAEGCLWTIQFEDYSNLTATPIPDTYEGTDNCYYNEEYGITITRPDDAYQVATRDILKQLDFDSDNLIDIKFTEQGLQIVLTTIQGIPFAWSTEVQARIWN